MNNNNGLDANYFKGKLALVMAGINNYTPQELASELARLAKTADNIAAAEVAHPPAQPTEQLYALLDKAASLLTESALSEDYDGDEALELVAAIRGEFADVGKTTVENHLEVLWEKIRIAAGFDQDDEFTLSEAIARISAPAQPDTEALKAQLAAQAGQEPSANVRQVMGSWFECHTIDEMQAFYLSRLPAIREAAKEHGYAIGEAMDYLTKLRESSRDDVAGDAKVSLIDDAMKNARDLEIMFATQNNQNGGHYGMLYTAGLLRKLVAIVASKKDAP